MAKRTTSGLSARLGGFCAGALSRPLADEAARKTRDHLLDTLAAMVSGAGMEPGRVAAAYVRSLGGTREAGLVAGRFRTTAVNAALANGMAAHADETDDSHPASLTHPGCAVVPAALAMAERQGCSGEDLLRAVALGYDMTARFGMALGGIAFIHRGFDSHAFGGVMGAAAAAGALTRPDPVAMSHILSYAAQQASGLATLFRDREHIEKAFVFGGMPARDGVAAATMVQAGMTGVADAFDGEPSFFSALGAGPSGRRAFDRLGRVQQITRTNIKRWSVGSPVQAALDCLEALMAAHDFKLGEVEKITVHLPESGARIVDGRHMPDINVQYLAAVMLLDGRVSFAASHDHARMEDAAVTALSRRV